jgi:16S rRNA (cytosine1402-N4)-methyltransferase
MEHTPVLLQESVDGLNIKPDGIYADGTTGRAGHAREIVKRLDTGRLIAIDRDYDAILEAKALLSGFEEKIIFIHGNFRDISSILSTEGIEAVDGMLFDLGVSSPQLDDASRGFSYKQDARLDMRMDKSEDLTAFEAVNSWQEDKLRKVFYEYGEERYSRSIAYAIVKRRTDAPISTTFELNDIITSAIPAAARREAQHPSKRCFQALRIAINDELGAVAEMLDCAPLKLKRGGRICVISFHSLEDRIVKNSFATYAKTCVCPKDIPVCVCGVKPMLKVITRKPITAGKEEAERNARARSAKLRIAERL